MKRELSDTIYALIFLIPLIVFLFSIVIYPITMSLIYSFHRVDFAKKVMEFVGFSNYIRLFSDKYFIHSLLVTLRFTIETAILSTLLSLGLALLLNEVLPFRGFFRAVVLLPYALSEFATAYSWRWFLSSDFGLLNGILYSLGFIKDYIWFVNYDYAVECLSVAYTWHIAPLGAFFILAGLQTIPEDLYRQAKVDGLGPVKRFFNITLPFIKYAILITMVISTMFSASSADIVILMTGGGPGIASSTLTYYTYERTFKGLEIGYGAAMSWSLIIMILSLAIVYFLLLTKRGR